MAELKLPDSFVDGLSDHDKQLAERAFEEARKQMLAGIERVEKSNFMGVGAEYIRELKDMVRGS